LTDIPALPRGKAHVEVMFQIDVNGIVKVSAEELYTETKTGIRIDASHLLAEEEVEQVIREAAAHAEEDRSRRGEAEINIRADSMIRAAELFLEEKEGKLSSASKHRIEQCMLDLKEALSQGESQVVGENTEALRRMLERS
jgi:molecular chaperone DnaK